MITAVLLAAALAQGDTTGLRPAPDMPGSIAHGRSWDGSQFDTKVWRSSSNRGPREVQLQPSEFYRFRCRPNAPYPGTDISCDPPSEPAAAPKPSITPGDVEAEAKLIRFPSLRVSVQPAGSTLVNLETIFHTTVTPFARTVDILDSTVALRATPVAYTWHHGDGTTQTTTSPGRPYPAMDVVHRYRKPGHVRPSVDVTYRVTYRIDDGDWESLDTTITAPGPGTALLVRDARPVLTD